MYFRPTASTSSIGIASRVCPFRPVTVVARSIELYTASSVDSMAAWKRGESRSPRSTPPVSSGDSDSNALTSEGAAENAITKSPLPCEEVAPVRARPSIARRASRVSPGERIGASVASTIMMEPSGFSSA